MMQLSELLKKIAVVDVSGPLAAAVAGLAYDSRRVAPGEMFFALPGVQADGFDFIPQALERGAVAVVCERLPAERPADVCFVRVENVRLAMALLAAEYHHRPTRDIPVIGVTGTNGKTTTTYLLEAILRQAGKSPAVFGTVSYRCGEISYPAPRTTPESIDLMRMLAEFRAHGADALILEVSSHALEQHRVDGIDFDVAVFTNLTPEHLDYHATLERYFVSKRRLFVELLGTGAAVINRDDPSGQRLLRENNTWLGYGTDSQAVVRPQRVTVGRDGIHGSFWCRDESLRIDSGMIGDFNVGNLLAAVGAAHALGIAATQISRGIARAPQVPGRLEKVANDSGILALVDYAHTGDALQQALSTLDKLEHKRLYTVVGCGGDRDPGKRPVMAAVAVQFSQLAIFTSDNPRTEDPLAILAQIRAGALAAGAKELNEEQALAGKDGFVVIPDRRRAIEFAVALARAGDLLLVAGKGHEDYQILGTEKRHFDDREELRRVLNDVSPATSKGDDADV